jgi:hypothetical protein
MGQCVLIIVWNFFYDLTLGLRPIMLMTHHEQMFPRTPTAVTPTPMSNDEEVGMAF